MSEARALLASLAAAYGAELNATLRRQVAEIQPPELATMLGYALGWQGRDGQEIEGSGGKRMRPYLLLLITEAAGGEWRQALPAAAAVELLHNFSLAHDDIQDQSETRHGRPSLWVAWDQARAINAGDSLLGLAFHCLATLREPCGAELTLRCWAELNDALRELTRGQQLDLSFERAAHIDEASYMGMIAGKTAALLAASATMGALIARSPRAAAYGEFGRQLGLAFQIRDDILGVWGESAQTGKSPHDDLRQKKKSLPIIIGLSREAELRQLFARAQLNEAAVRRAVILLERCGAREAAEAAEARHTAAALAALEQARPAGEAGQLLRRLPAALLGRAR